MNLKGTRFENNRLGLEIFVYDVDGKEMFIGKDIAKLLGYQNYSTAVSENIKPSQKKKVYVRTIENIGNSEIPKSEVINNNLTMITEIGVYQLVFRSNRKEAEEFQEWVYGEILPSIRKNNFYIDNKNFTNEDFEKLEEENRILKDKLGNYTNITLNNNRRCQSLETYLKQMFPNQKDVFEQFIDGFKRNGYLDENGKPTEIFEKKNKPHKIFKHLTEVCDGDSNKHTIILTNKGINLFANDLYIENRVLKCKNREGSTRII
ncbi:MAG: BRO-N domain-containing protein [Clostridium sp.]|uniref:BRO-N domain-containing protein n=1 Tax=Clostridium sp. TaxID=1506 RepID=UPI003EE60FF6